MSIHRAPLPQPKRPFDWTVAVLQLLIAASLIAVWVFVFWATGLLAYLQEVLTKDVLGYIAAAAMIIGFLAAFGSNNRRRGSRHID